MTTETDIRNSCKPDRLKPYPQTKTAKEEVSLPADSSLTKTGKTPCQQRVLLVSILNHPNTRVNDQLSHQPKICGWCHHALETPGKSTETIYARDVWGNHLGPLCRDCFTQLINDGLIPSGGVSITKGGL